MLQSKHSERPFILVTGGCGYIGANLINVLSTHGYRVRVLDDFSNGFAERLIGLDAEIIEGSLLDLDVGFIRKKYNKCIQLEVFNKANNIILK